MGRLAAPMPPEASDRLICAVLAAQVAELHDRIEGDTTVELLWRATEVLSSLSGLVQDLGPQVGPSDPDMAERCAVAVAAEAEISRLIGAQAFVQAQRQDFARQVADCVVTALSRMAADPTPGARFTAEDLAALYVCEEQRAAHKLVMDQFAAGSRADGPAHGNARPARSARPQRTSAASAWRSLLAVFAGGGRPAAGAGASLPPLPNQTFAATDSPPGDSSQITARAPELPSTAPALADPVPESSNRGTARDMETAMRLFGSVIVDQVNTSVNTVLAENDGMRGMAKEMAAASAQAKDQFKIALVGAEDAETAIHQLHACSSELTRSIEVIGSEVRRSIGIVRDGTAQADVTKSCVETMAVLAAGVSEVVELIDRVAFQSQILAFNAAVEAARAGESGRGFAVVALEMKQLSVQTSDATRVIEQKIGHMTDMVKQSVASLQTLVATIGNVDVASASIGRAVAEQVDLGARVSTSLDSMRTAFLALSREFREAAQLAANGGMLSEIVLETANSVDKLMVGLKGKLENIGAGLEPASADRALDAGTIGSPLREELAA